ncbi:hypothetical protein [Fibrella aestuarina]|uniref:hypothetical protein n=1 Tax=Fibrella aestuarina TaxID=651143 RepID=UPI001E424A9E|nr:hypothetical protein [Fibrella aestuarina]
MAYLCHVPDATRMTTNTIYTLLIDAATEQIQGDWTICRLTVHFLSDPANHATDIEFAGTYLDPTGEDHPLTTDFADEVTEAMQQLYQNRKRDGHPRANVLQVDFSPSGQFTTAYSWDQEMQDEDEHFSNGGTAKEWEAIRAAKYGNP